jgi:hypothetical protein
VLIRWATLLSGCLLVASGCSDAPAERRFMAEMIGLEMYTELESPVSTQVLEAGKDGSAAARGRPGGYRRAIVLHQSGLECDPYRDAVACGAKIEIFRTAARAEERSRLLESETASPPAESRTRVGALLLRMSSKLPAEDRADYRQALAHALESLPSRMQDKADVSTEGLERLRQ